MINVVAHLHGKGAKIEGCHHLGCVYCHKSPIKSKKCPRCKGKGVCVDFYVNEIPHLGKCHVCHGKGKVW